MEIKKMKLSDIKPALYNPRKNLKPDDPEYKKLKCSMEEFDCVEPLIWNKRTQHLVGGHQRLKILKEKGVKEFEVSIVDLDERREKALNIALNKIQGDWDFAKMADLLVELDDGELDLELTGFDMEEVKSIMEWTPDKEASLKIKGVKVVTEEEIRKQEKRLGGKESERYNKYMSDLLDVTCPYCSEIFKISKSGPI